jgi:hypothetical protein
MKTKNKPQAAQPALANSARPRHASGPSAPRPKRSKAQECYQAALGWLSLTAHTRTAATLHGKLRRRPVTVATARNLPPPLPIRYRPSSAARRHRPKSAAAAADPLSSFFCSLPPPLVVASSSRN